MKCGGPSLNIVNMTALLIFLVLFIPSVYAGCPKCIGRDYSMYTEGYIFMGGERITVKLANIDDKTHYVGEIELYLSLQDGNTIYIGVIIVNRSISPGVSYTFKITLPEVERDINATLYGIIDGETEVYSNDFLIKRNVGIQIINLAQYVLMIAAVLLAVTIWVKFMRS